MKPFKRGNLIAGGVLLLLGLALLLVAAHLPRPLQSQRQAERWAGESGMDFRQLSCVFFAGKTLESDAVLSFREKAAAAIVEANLDLPADSALCDAWSVGGSVKITGARGSFDATALAVGGRFFDFHPYALRSGGYLSESDLMLDRVVVDEQLAWMLYGSTDLAGMRVQIGDREYLIAGVVAQPDDRFTRALGTSAPTVYLDYTSRDALDGSGVYCYEVVLPEPVKGFAKRTVEDAFAKQALVVENTGRFTFWDSMQRLKTIGALGTRTEAVAFPAWENAAICAETWCALLRGAGLLCLVWPAALVCAAAWRLLRQGRQKLRHGGAVLREALLDRRDAQRERALRGKQCR